jgi:hypothetical protein
MEVGKYNEQKRENWPDIGILYADSRNPWPKLARN